MLHLFASTSLYYNIHPTPLYFVRSGSIASFNGRLRESGTNNFVWTSKASSKNNASIIVPSAYYLVLTGISVNPSGGPYDRWYGFPLRRPKSNYFLS